MSHHNADIWAQTAPVGGDPVWALYPMSGAWICLHLWEHYTFSQDVVHSFIHVSRSAVNHLLIILILTFLMYPIS